MDRRLVLRVPLQAPRNEEGGCAQDKGDEEHHESRTARPGAGEGDEREDDRRNPEVGRVA
ncbi:MAG: hypothetical protein ACRDG7_14530 [Candidatus Limnocylindria bacterium]